MRLLHRPRCSKTLPALTSFDGTAQRQRQQEAFHADLLHALG